MYAGQHGGVSTLYGGCMLSLCLPVCPRTPASKDMQLVGLSGDSNLPIGVNVCVNSCVFLCVSQATCPVSTLSITLLCLRQAPAHFLAGASALIVSVSS